MIDYSCKIEQALILAIAHSAKVEPYEVMAFFDDAINQMSQCPPNYTRRKGSKVADPDSKIDVPIWILRGYYPNTGIFFKITLINYSSHPYVPGYSAKVHHLNIYKVWKDMVILEADAVRRAIAERDLIGQDLPQVDLKPQRLMTPKGMKPFRLFTRRKRK